MKRIFQETLNEYCNQDYYPWHMPGHKRQKNLASHIAVENDVTELPGLDNLLAPEGAIAESMEQLQQVYGSAQSYYLVNGSTSGILAAISAICKRGDTIILGRHCHKSVYHAVMLLELKPVYIMPQVIEPYGICGSVSVKQVEQELKMHPEAKAVIFPSPTYEGVLSDIKSISRVVHEYGAKLIVDEAHGAHLEFASKVHETTATGGEIGTGIEAVPASAVRCGADLVIQSLHKTLPCYTQCAILHIGIGAEELKNQVERYLGVYQTSSPSYLLVSNMEDGIASMDEWRDTRVVNYYERLRKYRKQWSALKNITLLTPEQVQQEGCFAYDESKLVFCIEKDNVSGESLLEALEAKYGMVLEMASLHYVLGMTSVVDSEEAFVRLSEAIEAMDDWLQQASESQENGSVTSHSYERTSQCNIQENSPEKMDEDKKQQRLSKLLQMKDTVAKDFVTVYPPGIPVVVPGELITESQVAYLQKCLEQGLTVYGLN